MKTRNLLILTLFITLIFSCNKQDIKPDNIYKFKEYISYTTSGIVSASDHIKINLAKDVESWEADKEISNDVITIQPYISGKVKIINKHVFYFEPDEILEPNTEYSVTVKLDKIYYNIDKEYSNYTFQFKTITPNYSIQTEALQSYTKTHQYLNGLLKSADIISLEDAKKIITASQNNQKINIVWNESYATSKVFEFKIDSITRFVEDSKLTISWDGKPINADNKGEKEIIIPGKNNFKVLSVSVNNDENQFISINFSDAVPLAIPKTH